MSVEQFKELAQALLEMETDGKVVALWIAMSTGARKGEILGLTWKDVDLDAGKIGFNAQLTANKKRIPHLKNETSHRTRSIDVNTVNFLTNWWRAQSALFYGGKAVPLGAPVCCDDSGGFVRTSAFDNWRRRLFADHGLGKFKSVERRVDCKGHIRYKYSGYTGFRLHDLRHAQATFLASQNVDVKTIQERGGWASADVPMNIYAKYVAENDKTAANAISKLMPMVSLKSSEYVEAGRFGRFGSIEDGAQSSNARPRDLLVEPHRHRAVPMSTEVAQKKVLDCFEDEPEGALLSKKDIVARTGIFSAKCMSKALVALQGSGKIERVGRTKAARYRKAS